jgi:hypothetical protein
MAEPEDQWPDGLDVRNAEKEERDLYIKFKNWQYRAYGMQDHDLWEQYQEDFAGFTM